MSLSFTFPLTCGGLFYLLVLFFANEKMHGEEAPNPRHDQNPALCRRVAKQKEGSWETAWASYRGIINPWPWVWYDIPVFLIPILLSLSAPPLLTPLWIHKSRVSLLTRGSRIPFPSFQVTAYWRVCEAST